MLSGSGQWSKAVNLHSVLVVLLGAFWRKVLKVVVHRIGKYMIFTGHMLAPLLTLSPSDFSKCLVVVSSWKLPHYMYMYMYIGRYMTHNFTIVNINNSRLIFRLSGSLCSSNVSLIDGVHTSIYAWYPQMYDCTLATLSEFPGICEAIAALSPVYSLLQMLKEFVHVLLCHGCFRETQTPSLFTRKKSMLSRNPLVVHVFRLSVRS